MDRARSRQVFGTVAIVVGVGLVVYGLTAWHGGGRRLGYTVAGWSSDAQLLMAIGAMLITVGALARQYEPHTWRSR